MLCAGAYADPSGYTKVSQDTQWGLLEGQNTKKLFMHSITVGAKIPITL